MALASQPSLDAADEGKANGVRYPWTSEVSENEKGP